VAKLEAVEREIADAGGFVRSVMCDVGDRAQVDEMVGTVVNRGERSTSWSTTLRTPCSAARGDH
jgi:hypothetical protein